jgi:hypothetical protein
MIMDDLIEGLIALSSEEYLLSIKTARKGYKEGRVKSLEKIF